MGWLPGSGYQAVGGYHFPTTMQFFLLRFCFPTTHKISLHGVYMEGVCVDGATKISMHSHSLSIMLETLLVREMVGCV